CTPDFFGFNANDELQYRGRLDASRTSLVPGARRELFEAMSQVAETGRGPLEQTASMGCSIKWRGLKDDQKNSPGLCRTDRTRQYRPLRYTGQRAALLRRTVAGSLRHGPRNRTINGAPRL